MGGGTLSSAMGILLEFVISKEAHWYVSPEWWLAVFALVTLVVVMVQTRATAKAAKAASDAASAARLGVEAANRQATAIEAQTGGMIASERAYVDGYLVECNQLSIRSYALRIKNHGKTAARISGYDVRSGCLTAGGLLSPEELRQSDSVNFETLLGGGETEDLERDIRMDQLFESCDVQKGAYYVRIRYIDMIVGKEHETSFLYTYDPLLNVPERISAENRYT